MEIPSTGAETPGTGLSTKDAYSTSTTLEPTLLRSVSTAPASRPHSASTTETLTSESRLSEILSVSISSTVTSTISQPTSSLEAVHPMTSGLETLPPPIKPVAHPLYTTEIQETDTSATFLPLKSLPESPLSRKDLTSAVPPVFSSSHENTPLTRDAACTPSLALTPPEIQPSLMIPPSLIIPPKTNITSTELSLSEPKLGYSQSSTKIPFRLVPKSQLTKPLSAQILSATQCSTTLVPITATRTNTTNSVTHLSPVEDREISLCMFKTSAESPTLEVRPSDPKEIESSQSAQNPLPTTSLSYLGTPPLETIHLETEFPSKPQTLQQPHKAPLTESLDCPSLVLTTSPPSITAQSSPVSLSPMETQGPSLIRSNSQNVPLNSQTLLSPDGTKAGNTPSRSKLRLTIPEIAPSLLLENTSQDVHTVVPPVASRGIPVASHIASNVTAPDLPGTSNMVSKMTIPLLKITPPFLSELRPPSVPGSPPLGTGLKPPVVSGTLPLTPERFPFKQPKTHHSGSELTAPVIRVTPPLTSQPIPPEVIEKSSLCSELTAPAMPGAPPSLTPDRAPTRISGTPPIGLEVTSPIFEATQCLASEHILSEFSRTSLLASGFKPLLMPEKPPVASQLKPSEVSETPPFNSMTTPPALSVTSSPLSQSAPSEIPSMSLVRSDESPLTVLNTPSSSSELTQSTVQSIPPTIPVKPPTILNLTPPAVSDTLKMTSEPTKPVMPEKPPRESRTSSPWISTLRLPLSTGLNPPALSITPPLTPPPKRSTYNFSGSERTSPTVTPPASPSSASSGATAKSPRPTRSPVQVIIPLIPSKLPWNSKSPPATAVSLASFHPIPTIKTTHYARKSRRKDAKGLTKKKSKRSAKSGSSVASTSRHTVISAQSHDTTTSATHETLVSTCTYDTTSTANVSLDDKGHRPFPPEGPALLGVPKQPLSRKSSLSTLFSFRRSSNASQRKAEQEKPPQKLRLILVGNNGVGKSTFLQTLVSGNFRPSNVNTNLCSAHTRCTIIHKGRFIELDIQDTAGQERFRSLTASYYRYAQCCLVFFNVHEPESFRDVEYWLNDLTTYGGREGGVAVVLVGLLHVPPKPRKRGYHSEREQPASEPTKQSPADEADSASSSGVNSMDTPATKETELPSAQSSDREEYQAKESCAKKTELCTSEALDREECRAKQRTSGSGSRRDIGLQVCIPPPQNQRQQKASSHHHHHHHHHHHYHHHHHHHHQYPHYPYVYEQSGICTSTTPLFTQSVSEKKREIPTEQAEHLAEMWGIPYREVDTAQDYGSVLEAVHTLMDSVLAKAKQEFEAKPTLNLILPQTSRRPSLDLLLNNDNRGERTCCLNC
ncbi:Ras-related protein Rap-1b [Elysia marginata]|uniref:Ras-related protein Rap-1b n=1 Tax=Elysia marginata TaxID=1093978 RepID=A0AAV4GY51_9GAST|nr:Ras-related protein Rap-1b [Elysia marginata]